MSLRIHTLRDNVKVYKLGAGEVEAVMAALTIYGQLKNLFGGGSGDSGHWEGDKFIPGDLQNRLKFISEHMASRGLTTADVDMTMLQGFLYQEGIWQAKVDQYLQVIEDDKRANPEKYKNKVQPGGVEMPTGLANLGNLPTLLLVGAALFLLYNLTKRK